MANGAFSKVADDWDLLTDAEKVALFHSASYESPAISDLAALGKFKVVTYSESADPITCSISAVPKDQLVLPKGLISTDSFEGIDKATVTYDVNANSNCRILITTDLTNYYTYDASSGRWQEVDITIADISSLGILSADLVNIPRTGWDLITIGKTGIGFAYLLSKTAVADTCEISQLDLQVDMKGSWEKAVYGTECKYGYPKNNLLRVTLLADGDYKINYHSGK